MVSGQTSTRTMQKAASHGVVQDYLDVLLGNILPDDVAARAEAEIEHKADLKPASTPAVSWSTDLVSESMATLAAAPLLKEAATPDTDSGERIRNTAPWTDKPFASLLFDVNGLKLAAPLHELGGIMPLADKLQPMAAQAPWFMGLIRWNNRTIRVVDTARFVMPERIANDQSLDYQSVVVLGDSHWALAVNNADQSVHLQPADIRWRKTLGKRPWLAGTVLEHLCALLDIDVLIAMLDASDTAKQVKADLARQN